MIFWSLFLVLLAIAVLCILLPLSRRVDAASDDVQPLDVYVEQLAALEGKQVEDGAAQEALAQEKAEISRRILKQARSDAGKGQGGISTTSSRSRIGASLVALVVLPAVAIGTYLYTGSPGVPDQPLSARAIVDTDQARSTAPAAPPRNSARLAEWRRSNESGNSWRAPPSSAGASSSGSSASAVEPTPVAFWSA